jgi:hypothetical protein
MERLLLFDAECMKCARLAAAVERAGVRVATRPLADLDMQALVQHARPQWRWEPTLLEFAYGGPVRVTTGPAMRARLIWLLGPRRAWLLWQRARRLEIGPIDRVAATVDRPLLDATAAVLMGTEFARLRPRLTQQAPVDAWHDANSDEHLIAFNVVAERGHERLAIFATRRQDDHHVVLRMSEVVVDATSEGWRASTVEQKMIGPQAGFTGAQIAPLA